MDCHGFRKHHLAYLDDTLSGDQTAAAQRHILACDACAAHDTLVRRSLMMARNIPVIEPTSEFQSRLRARLAACRDDAALPASDTRVPFWKSRGALSGFDDGCDAAFLADPVVSVASSSEPAPTTRYGRTIVVAMTAGAILALGWRGIGTSAAAEVAMQPVIATQPALSSQNPYVTPAMMRAMSTGNPVWPAALLIEDAPSHIVMASMGSDW